MEALWGFIGTIIGATASIIATIINTKNMNKIQQNIELAKKQERHNEFQCENLKKIQEELIYNIRLIAEVHLSDTNYYTENSSVNNRPFVKEPLNTKLRESKQQLLILNERIGNDELRIKINNYRKLLFEIEIASSKNESEIAITNIISSFEVLNSDIGDQIRKLYIKII